MTLSIRNAEGDAVPSALREAVNSGGGRETAREAARRILASRGLSVRAGRKPAPQSAYHDLDHDPAGEDTAESGSAGALHHPPL